MRSGEAGRQWNGPARTHFSGSRPETAPGGNHHAPWGLTSRSRSDPPEPPQRAQAQPPPSARPPPSPASLFPRRHKTPNKTLKEGQLVPKISGCRRWGLTATSTLCFCPRNWMAKRTTGYSATSPCTHLTRTMQLISNASGWTRLWWIEVWLQPESTKAQYVPPLILTGIWYPPAWLGAACGTSGTRTKVPTSITGHRSIKWPGSPQRQQAGPGFPATPVAGRRTRNWRGETGETGPAAGLGPADPASRPWALAAVDSGAGPPSIGAGLGEPRRHGTWGGK